MLMVSYALTESVSEIRHQKEKRTDLWYDEYRYAVRVYLHEAGCLRPGTHEGVDRRIKIRREWGRRSRNIGGSWAASWKTAEITDSDVINLHAMLDFLASWKDLHRVAISSDWLYIYTNEQAMVDSICDLPYINSTGRIIRITECELHGEPGAICLQESKYQYRTYFRSRFLAPLTAQSLRQYLRAQNDIRLGPGLESWCTKTWNDTQSHYFFDHSDARIAQMLMLIAPDLVRKTRPILVQPAK
jgi:hypothetical protein